MITFSRPVLNGIELNYAEITSTFTTASASAVDVTGLTVPVTVGLRPVYVWVALPNVYNTSTGHVGLQITDGTTTRVFQITGNANTANHAAPAPFPVRFPAGGGAKTFKLQMLAGVTGTATIYADTNYRAAIFVLEA